jgi:hypothetical protein
MVVNSNTATAWAALSRGFYFHCQSEARATDLILERKPHKLRFTLVKGLSEASGTLWADRSPALLDDGFMAATYIHTDI